ncbi:DNA polymerase-3 subunit chi [Caulobacter ginsengisoli]|uniref:DNA polymerase-3 subunit chi n=1 Tax=Caulobacter ginsengisoli TaxID=400775 RepID=A0ABU0IPY4_9CAUL|nr:DNA polymerase III subunit chi [Caulobacter ginsengisoli]MDQ0464067.1 DNA polymerase-3 subunit chi [Caulobacter ginsengisoli]
MAEGGCEVWFYHLERSSLDQVLPELLEKTLQKGWKALVRTREPERLEHLDGWLWSWRDDAFLPHGTADEPLAARQPVLLTTKSDNLNGAEALFLIDGAEAGDLSPYQRCILLFDGRDEEALAEARGRWKTFKAEGLPVSYWRQGETRGWEKIA